MKLHFGLALVAAGVLVVGCDKQPAAPATATNQQSGNPITAPVDYLGAVVKAQEVAVKKIDIASLSSALQLFNAQEGRYPKDLNELVSEKYLAKLPPVPNGMKLQYDAASGQVSVVKQ